MILITFNVSDIEKFEERIKVVAFLLDSPVFGVIWYSQKERRRILKKKNQAENQWTWLKLISTASSLLSIRIIHLISEANLPKLKLRKRMCKRVLMNKLLVFFFSIVFIPNERMRARYSNWYHPIHPTIVPFILLCHRSIKAKQKIDDKVFLRNQHVQHSYTSKSYMYYTDIYVFHYTHTAYNAIHNLQTWRFITTSET